MNSQKETQPSRLINVDIPIISSYRKEQHVNELKTAALYFKDLGLSTYPSHLQRPINIDDEFVLFDGDIETFGFNKRRTEIEFLKAINKARVVYVVATNGYIGRSGSIELAYGLLMNAPLALSQSITEFGQEVPKELKTVIENHKTLIPILPIEKIKELKMDRTLAALPNREKPFLTVLNEEDKKTILLSIRSLVRHLEK